MKQIIITAVFTLLFLTSCNKNFYQVYQVKAPNLEESDNSLVYENEDLKILYNLWANSGNFHFIIHNKSEKNLFVVLPQSFMIKNGIALNYFNNREYSHTSEFFVGYDTSINVNDFSNNNELYNVNTKKTKSKNKAIGESFTTTIIEEPIICIPPRSAKVLGEYSIFDKIISKCNRSQDYPKKISSPLFYSKENSPMHFINRIAYSYNDKGQEPQFIENEFWISEIINYSEKEATSLESIKECEYNNSQIIRVFKIGAPNKFYNSYKETPKVYDPAY